MVDQFTTLMHHLKTKKHVSFIHMFYYAMRYGSARVPVPPSNVTDDLR